jgi:DUF971 family protein
MNAGVPVPYAIRRLENGAVIEIEWEQARHTGRYSARELRLACPCAGCVEELSGRALLDPATVPGDVRALAIKLVGAYAVHVQWSDGHGTGMYPWALLFRLCPCPECAASRRPT